MLRPELELKTIAQDAGGDPQSGVDDTAEVARPGWEDQSWEPAGLFTLKLPDPPHFQGVGKSSPREMGFCDLPCSAHREPRLTCVWPLVPPHGTMWAVGRATARRL